MPSRRDLIKMTDEEVHDYLHAPRTMNVATHNHDGTIHLVAMWYGFLDGAPAFWTFGKSQKIRNLERDPRLTCLVESGADYAELMGVELVGTGEVITDHDVVMRIGASVLELRTGLPASPDDPGLQQMGRKRYGVKVHVERVVSWDHRKLGGTY